MALPEPCCGTPNLCSSARICDFILRVMPWDFVLLLIVLGVLAPWQGVVKMRRLLALPHISSADRLAVYATTIALQWMLAAVAAWRCWAREVSLAELGLTLPNAELTVAVGVALAATMGAGQIGGLRQLARLPAEKQGILGALARKLMPQDGVERLAFVALVGTVALCEEFLFRGFVYAAVARATQHSMVAAVVCSSLIFALGHAYQGRRGVAVTFAVGLVFAAARVWTGSLAAGMVAHFTTDLIAGWAGPGMLAERPEKRKGSTDLII
jgi:membrane protease YdiL (CAAX protease family)